MRWFTRALCAFLMVPLAGVPAASPTHAVERPAAAGAAGDAGMEAPRILLYGDSLTQGTAAQWTWRYRLWQGLTAAGTSFDFVGPVATTSTYPGWSPTSVEYRARFDTDAASMGGNMLTRSFVPVSTLVDDHDADIVVGLIGVNDLRKKVSVDQLVTTWREEIVRARRLTPMVSFVLVQIGQTWVEGVPAYNDALVRLARDLDRRDARVLVTERPLMTAWPDTFDWLHLTASGEHKYAAVVSDALAVLGLASAPAPADPPDDGSWAPMPAATLNASWIHLTWPQVDYASSVSLYVVDETTGSAGKLSYLTGTEKWLPGQPGHTYTLRLAPVQGYAEIGTRSLPLTVTVPAP